MLETDSKSLRSVNGSRRNSGSSLVSSSSASSNLSHLEEDSWILWGRIVNEWEDVRKKKEKQVKELVRKGIPHHFRAIVWQLLCSAQSMPIKDQYSELLKMTSPCEKLIRRDIARTYPEHNFFKEKDSLGQEVLFNVMKAYSLVDREVGYCQGSAFIVGLLLMQHKCSSNYNEDFVLQLEKELVQARLSEAESQCALKEMQDKVLDIEKRNNSFPDENNIARLQEELIAVKLREAEAIMGLKELRQQVRDLEEHWQCHLARTTGRWKDPPKKNTVNELQDELMTIRLKEAETQAEIREIKQRMMEMETQNQINSNHLRRAEQEAISLQEKVQYLSAQNKGLLTQLSEAKRKQAEIECKNKEEVMAVRLREADSIAAVAELQQHIAELEIQKEEGKLQGQLNKSDSNQYIRELKDQIAELNHELRCLKGQRGFSGQPPFDGIHIVNHLIGDDESFHSSDEDFLDNSLQESGVGFPLHRKSGPMSLDPTVADGSESETEDSVLETRETDRVAQKERRPRRKESYSTTV